ncbi:MAG: hypothetical protein HUJ52_01685, partial [Malacoplasma sp.]|nr:hypothetical protein [Malacoplasma sp.]
MNKATNIKIISNEACQKLIKECEKENKLLDAKIKTLEKKKDKIKAILDSSKINDKKAYKLFKKQAVVYTRIKKAINNSKAKHISNQYYIKWLSLNNVSKNKNNEYIFA